MIAALFLPEAAAFWVLMGGIGIAALIPVVMSCIWYRSRKEDKKHGRIKISLGSTQGYGIYDHFDTFFYAQLSAV